VSLFLYLYHMSRFNWWRRYSKKPKLSRKDAFKGKSYLLQQIEHGDFDHSDYMNQAREEMDRMKADQKKITKAHLGGQDSLKEKLDECERKYRKRYNKLLEDYNLEENRLLLMLRESLAKEAGIDVWNRALTQDTNSLVEFYHHYHKTAKQRIKEYESSKSEETPVGELC
jgi:hypothetical protein